jgi:hypothetical protein
VISIQGIASMKEVLVQLIAGTAAFGKLSANTAATYIGDVVLQAGTAAIGKLAANTAATYIGDVILQAGTAAIGKLAANSAGTYIGDILVSSSTGATSSVAASGSSVTILAGNSSRKGATIVNDSTSVLYLRMTTAGSAASSTSYSYYLPGTNASGVPSTLEVPYRCTDTITGIWVSATGSARVTEYT